MTTEITLPVVCGSQCPLYDVKTHTCNVSGNPKKAQEECDYDYTTKQVKNISDGKPLNS